VRNVVRPKKPVIVRRENHLTIYLTDEEQVTLTTIAKLDNRAMTQVVVVAVKEWINRLMNPPESLRQTKYEKIMQEKSATLRGYVCRNGHPF
jgi:hypothetical protein